MLSFSDLLVVNGLNPSEVRLLRHRDNRYKGQSPYVMWRDNRPAFEEYQRTQGFGDQAKLNLQFWASFVGLPNKETLFVGIYAADYLGATPTDRTHPATGAVIPAGSCNHYALTQQTQMAEAAGRLVINWGEGFRAWIQRADRKPKPVIEYRKEFSEPDFPGFSRIILKLSEIDIMPLSWAATLASTRGIYVLTCPRTREQYVGSTVGAAGFVGRWKQYAASGHGGNVGLKSREASDYQISILETVGSAATDADILALESLWKQKLQSREMGLNRN